MQGVTDAEVQDAAEAEAALHPGSTEWQHAWQWIWVTRYYLELHSRRAEACLCAQKGDQVRCRGIR